MTQGNKSELDCSDDLAMRASWSAPKPRQVSCLTCRFAGLTGGTVARAHSSLDSPRDRLAAVCRLRNNVHDVVRELLKASLNFNHTGV